MDRVSAAMADIQRDPRAAMKKYGGDEEVVQFILAFMRLLGQQMESGEEKQGVEMKDGEKAPRGSEKERESGGGSEAEAGRPAANPAVDVGSHHSCQPFSSLLSVPTPLFAY